MRNVWDRLYTTANTALSNPDVKQEMLETDLYNRKYCTETQEDIRLLPFLLLLAHLTSFLYMPSAMSSLFRTKRFGVSV